MTTRTPNTFIVGAGPVATALAGALRLGGVPVLGLWARRPQAARAAGAVSGVASYSSAPPDLLLEADVIILAVRDQAIADVASVLVKTGLVTRQHIMLHCSGALSSAEAFSGVRDHIGGIGALHPLRAIADARAAMRELSGTVFGVEGDARGEAEALNLVRAMGGRALALSGDHMVVYHAAAAIASNYAVALMDAAVTLLGQVGIDESDAIGALVPLAVSSLENLAANGLANGLTGPIRRGDAETVARHVDILASGSELRQLYQTLGRATLAIARRVEGADQNALDQIARILANSAEEPPANSATGQ